MSDLRPAAFGVDVELDEFDRVVGVIEGGGEDFDDS